MKTIYYLAFVLCAVMLANCGKKSEQKSVDSAQQNLPQPSESVYFNNAAANELWRAGGDALSSCVPAANSLRERINQLLENPSENSLQSAQSAWQEMLLVYRQFYAFRFVALSNPQAFKVLAELDFRIAAYPVQPGALDSFGSYKYSGLVHDIGNPITSENLLNLHGQIDVENATLGLFAIEYMLFGEEKTRAVGDYAAAKALNEDQRKRGFTAIAELPQSRRRMLLALQAEALERDTHTLLNNWNNGGANSQLSIWKRLGNEEKNTLLRNAFERSLAQLIVDITGFNDSKNIQYQGIRREFITNAVRSIFSIPAAISPEKEARAVQEELAALEKLLTVKTETDSKTGASPDWQLAYTHINKILSLVSPVAGAVQPPQTTQAAAPTAKSN